MKRITVKLIGENGNAFNLIAIVRKALIKNGLYTIALEIFNFFTLLELKVSKSHRYIFNHPKKLHNYSFIIIKICFFGGGI